MDESPPLHELEDVISMYKRAMHNTETNDSQKSDDSVRKMIRYMETLYQSSDTAVVPAEFENEPPNIIKIIKMRKKNHLKKTRSDMKSLGVEESVNRIYDAKLGKSLHGIDYVHSLEESLDSIIKYSVLNEDWVPKDIKQTVAMAKKYAQENAVELSARSNSPRSNSPVGGFLSIDPTSPLNHSPSQKSPNSKTFLPFSPISSQKADHRSALSSTSPSKPSDLPPLTLPSAPSSLPSALFLPPRLQGLSPRNLPNRISAPLQSIVTKHRQNSSPLKGENDGLNGSSEPDRPYSTSANRNTTGKSKLKPFEALNVKLVKLDQEMKDLFLHSVYLRQDEEEEKERKLQMQQEKEEKVPTPTMSRVGSALQMPAPPSSSAPLHSTLSPRIVHAMTHHHHRSESAPETTPSHTHTHPQLVESKPLTVRFNETPLGPNARSEEKDTSKIHSPRPPSSSSARPPVSHQPTHSPRSKPKDPPSKPKSSSSIAGSQTIRSRRKSPPPDLSTSPNIPPDSDPLSVDASQPQSPSTPQPSTPKKKKPLTVSSEAAYEHAASQLIKHLKTVKKYSSAILGTEETISVAKQVNIHALEDEEHRLKTSLRRSMEEFHARAAQLNKLHATSIQKQAKFEATTQRMIQHLQNFDSKSACCQTALSLIHDFKELQRPFLDQSKFISFRMDDPKEILTSDVLMAVNFLESKSYKKYNDLLMKNIFQVKWFAQLLLSLHEYITLPTLKNTMNNNTTSSSSSSSSSSSYTMRRHNSMYNHTNTTNSSSSSSGPLPPPPPSSCYRILFVIKTLISFGWPVDISIFYLLLEKCIYQIEDFQSIAMYKILRIIRNELKVSVEDFVAYLLSNEIPLSNELRMEIKLKKKLEENSQNSSSSSSSSSSTSSISQSNLSPPSSPSLSSTRKTKGGQLSLDEM